METQEINLFIVDDNRSMVTALKLHLQAQFGTSIKISTFYDGNSCIEKINEDTQIVILDYEMQDQNGIEVLKAIKKINHNTQVIMLSSNNDMLLAMQSLNLGAVDYLVKSTQSWIKLTALVNTILTENMRRLANS